MGDPKGFLKIRRATAGVRPPDERLESYNEFVVEPDDPLAGGFLVE